VNERAGDDELVELFPGVVLTHDNAPHYRARLGRRLLVNRCADCGTWHHPPKPICPSCWSTGVLPTEVGGTGTVFMAIYLHQGPPVEGVDYAVAPHPVVTVELAEQEGLRFTTTVPGATPETLPIGTPVVLDWAEPGRGPLPVFRPAKVA